MILAHLGHWYVSLMYFGPVAALVGYLWIQGRRDRRRARREGGE